MSVTSNKFDINLKLILNNGVNQETGKEVQKTKSFANIKEDAADDGMYSAALALAGLQTHAVKAVRKQETYELTNE